MIKNLNTDIYKIDILDLIHEMGHFIYDYLFDFIYDAPLHECQDIVINNEFLKKLLGIGDNYNRAGLNVMYPINEMLEVVGIIEYDNNLLINPYSEIGVYDSDNSKRYHGIWYIEKLSLILNEPDTNAKLSYFTFLKLQGDIEKIVDNDTEYYSDDLKKNFENYKRSIDMMEEDKIPYIFQEKFFESVCWYDESPNKEDTIYMK